MTTRDNVGGVLFAIAMTAALWTLSGGVASAQGPVRCAAATPPCPFVTCPVRLVIGCEEGECVRRPSRAPSRFFTPTENVKVFVFGPENSIQVKFAR